ncbi:UNVERIFIED_CONTAM: E3 ubiquitin-protein ligase [Siphonaria sp. JEL0065]|nr:E3 ubiquitin-protein ligase [Siphonaria sp. JEL0065]
MGLRRIRDKEEENEKEESSVRASKRIRATRRAKETHKRDLERAIHLKRKVLGDEGSSDGSDESDETSSASDDASGGESSTDEDEDDFIVADDEVDLDPTIRFSCVCGKSQRVNSYSKQKLQCSTCSVWVHAACFDDYQADDGKLTCNSCLPRNTKKKTTPTGKLALYLHEANLDGFSTLFSLITPKSLLLEPVPENNNRTLLHSVCAHDKPLLLTQLLTSAASILKNKISNTSHNPLFMQDNDSLTPLHIATVWSLDCLRSIKSHLNSSTSSFSPLISKRLVLMKDSGGCTALARGILANAHVENLTFLMTWMKELGFSLKHLAGDFILEEDNNDVREDEKKKKKKKKSKTLQIDFDDGDEDNDMDGSKVVDLDKTGDDSICFLAARMGRGDVLKECSTLFGVAEMCRELSMRTVTGATPLHYASASSFALRSTSCLECVTFMTSLLLANNLENIITARDSIQSKTKRGGRTAALFAVGSETPWSVSGAGVNGSASSSSASVEEDEEELDFGIQQSCFVQEDLSDHDSEKPVVGVAAVKQEEELETEDQLWEKQQAKDSNLLQVVVCLLDAGIPTSCSEQGSGTVSFSFPFLITLNFCRDVLGTSLLHLAALHGLENIVRLLLQRGVQPTVKDKLHWTPLIYAHWGESCDQIPDGCLLALLEKDPTQLGSLMQLMNDASGHEKIISRLMKSLTTKPRAHKFVNEFLRSDQGRRHEVLEWFSGFPGLLDHQNKVSIFRRYILDAVSCGSGVVDVLAVKDSEFLSAFNQLGRYSSAPSIVAHFVDSIGGGPGVTREFWDNLSKDMVKPMYATFAPFGVDPSYFSRSNDSASVAGSSNCLFFAPDKALISSEIDVDVDLNTAQKKERTSATLVRFAGKICAMAIMNNQLLPGLESLSSHIFRLLVQDSISLTWKDFETLDAELYKSWDWVMNQEKKETLESTELTFSYDEKMWKDGYTKTVTKPFPGHKVDDLVTVENRHEFVELAAKCWVRRFRYKIVAFREGFTQVIPRKILRILEPTDLEVILCGMPIINIPEWKRATTYESYVFWNSSTTAKESQLKQWFWEIVEQDMSEADRVLLLKFATGMSRTPVGGWKFKVAFTGAPSANLPSATFLNILFRSIDGDGNYEVTNVMLRWEALNRAKTSHWAFKSHANWERFLAKDENNWLGGMDKNDAVSIMCQEPIRKLPINKFETIGSASSDGGEGSDSAVR